jgi:3-methyl-2-oxobutanoate hydroxymethyltransferase
MKTTTQSIRQAKGRRLLACLTAYDTITANIAARGGADLILVGDSVGNTLLGLPDTIGVTLDMMLHHTAAVARTRTQALIVADIPFGIAHDDFPAVLHAATRLMQAGAEAVKIEGGQALAPTIARLTTAGIPVCGHVGLQPQQVRQIGGHKKFGARENESATVLADATAVENAGAFAIVGEHLTAPLAAQLRATLTTPLIGIGSGEHCDGQILVIHDLLGLTEKPPTFVTPTIQLGHAAIAAVNTWVTQVRAPSPQPPHTAQ